MRKQIVYALTTSLMFTSLAGCSLKRTFTVVWQNWDGEVPENIKIDSWTRRWPFFIAAMAVFVAFMVVEIIFWATGHYPFL